MAEKVVLSEEMLQRVEVGQRLVERLVTHLPDEDKETTLELVLATLNAAYLNGYDDATFSVKLAAEKTGNRALQVMARQLNAGRAALEGAP